MDIINPIVFNASMLTSSSVGEADHPAWTTGAYVKTDRVILPSTHRRYECAVQHTTVTTATSLVGVTMTIAAPAVVTWAAHGLANGAEVIFTTTGSLPTGVTAGMKYYVSGAAADTFNLVASLAVGALTITTTGTQAGAHTAKVASTSPDTATDKWIDLGSTNKHAMFDEKWGTQTTASGSLSVTLTPNVVIDSIALLNMIGSSVTITSTCAGMTPYSKTIPLISDAGVYDWKTYFLAPIVAEADAVVTDLKPFRNQVIVITITGTGTVAIGNLTMGVLIALGNLQYSPKITHVSYSKKETDAYGNITVVKRPYAKRFSGRISVPASFVDQLAGILASVRDTPVVWVGVQGMYGSLVVWGFFKEFEIEIPYPTLSFCSLTIEGLV